LQCISSLPEARSQGEHTCTIHINLTNFFERHLSDFQLLIGFVNRAGDANAALDEHGSLIVCTGKGAHFEYNSLQEINARLKRTQYAISFDHKTFDVGFARQKIARLFPWNSLAHVRLEVSPEWRKLEAAVEKAFERYDAEVMAKKAVRVGRKQRKATSRQPVGCKRQVKKTKM